MADDALDRHDVQGLVVRGYGGLPAARYLLAAIDEPAGARAWLRRLADEVNPGNESAGDEAVNVALTSAGLRALGLPARIGTRFSREFIDGMTEPHRRRILGDVDESAPERWLWGGPDGDEVHLLLLVFARHERTLADATRRHEEAMRQGGIRPLRALDTAPLEDREHFGFVDGVSQPRLAGLGGDDALHTIQDGEVVLGYRNEYRRFTPRPLVPAADDPQGLLAVDAAGSGDRDLGRNGAYLVMRQLSQDVLGFWEFCERATARPDGSPDERARVWLAAKLVGRWPSGAPLVLAPEEDRPDLRDANDFGYFHEDRHGLRCPLGAHVRRANPRDSLDPHPGTARSVAVNKRHRLLRRGRKYGSLVGLDDLLSAGTDTQWRDDDRGLHFICLVANLSRQFEFVQHSWLGDPRFDALYDHPDPLLGPEPAGGRTFSVPADPVRRRYTDLPRFVAVRGGAYFFLPGLRALRYLAALPG
jgi:Dyp-type peroxidase family